MTKERRRYFRINETLGITYQVLEVPGEKGAGSPGAPTNPLDRIGEHDSRIETLLTEVALTHPRVAELIDLFNQKLDRAVSQLVMDNRLVDRIARRVKEANISACGIAFADSSSVPVGTTLRLELTLFPEEVKLVLRGRVVGCEPSDDGNSWYWRIDFCDLNEQTQEQLIQHIVKRQSAQLKRLRTE